VKRKKSSSRVIYDDDESEGAQADVEIWAGMESRRKSGMASGSGGGREERERWDDTRRRSMFV
jgi:hypothetical protein